MTAPSPEAMEAARRINDRLGYIGTRDNTDKFVALAIDAARAEERAKIASYLYPYKCGCCGGGESIAAAIQDRG